MFSTLVTILRGRSERARENLETANAAIIIEQKIREAQAGHDRAKRSLASLILRERNEARMLAGLQSRVDDLEARAREALDAGMEDLAGEAAQSIADLESEQKARQTSLTRTQQSVQRLRLLVEKCDRRLVELRQGLITAKAMEAERVTSSELRGDIAGVAAIVEGEQVLDRLLGSADSVEEMDVLDEINAELRGEDVVERLAAEGFGAPVKTHASDVLARLRSKPAPKSATQSKKK